MDLLAVSTGLTFCLKKKKRRGKKTQQQEQVLPGAQCSFSNFEKQIMEGPTGSSLEACLHQLHLKS